MKIRFPNISAILSIILLFLFTGDTKAQLLQKSSDKIKQLTNISYIDIVHTKFSFQESFFADTVKSDVMPGKPGINENGKYLLHKTNTSYAFDGNKLVTLMAEDSTYRIQNESVSGQYTRTLIHWSKEMSKLSSLPKAKIIENQDTLIGNRPFANIQVVRLDTLNGKEHFYTIDNFIIDKKTLLPVQITSKFRGAAYDGSIIGLVEIHNYSGYAINQKNFPDLSSIAIPSHYKLPVKRKPVIPLEKGTAAPLLKASDLYGKLLDQQRWQGKMVLINFSLIGCPHCVGAAQMLNRLKEKYNDKNLVILNIYPLDNPDAITKFDKRENVQTVSYTADKEIQKLYPYDGYPSFYLIDKNGKVAKTYNGYYVELEAKLIQKIDSML